MTQIIADASLPTKLANLTQPVEVCDTQGNVLGRFTPLLNPKDYILEPQVSDEELRRRAQSNERTYTTAEVLKYLESL